MGGCKRSQRLSDWLRKLNPWRLGDRNEQRFDVVERRFADDWRVPAGVVMRHPVFRDAHRLILQGTYSHVENYMAGRGSRASAAM